MTSRHRAGLLLAVAFAAFAARDARADLTATYDGSLTLKTTGEVSVLAGSLVQAANGLSGSVAISMADPAASGVYFVAGSVKGKGKKIVLLGANQAGTQLKYKGKVSGDTVNGNVKLRGAATKLKGSLSMLRRVVTPPTSAPVTCDNPFFTGQVMGLVLQPVCGSCHIEGGAAASAQFRVTSSDPIATMASVALQIDKAHPDESRILQKPLGVLPHSGGIQLLAGSEQYDVLQQWVSLVATDQHCEVTPEAPLVPMPADDLLVRASMDLRGKRPTMAELDAVDADPNAYDQIVNQYLNSPEFIEQVKDVYDDALLLRREDFSDESRDETSAIYGEALELIAYIVNSNRPFTEIGTADYTVANDLFQRDTERMPFPMEPVVGPAWQPTHYTDDRPHAGILSTSAFYDVWDTNDTNKNRGRANRFSILFHCYNFLDTPVDVTRDVDNADGDAVLNAVTSRPDCKACHDRLDPLASFLFPLDRANGLEDGDAPSMEFFSGNPERWRSANRRPPSVYGLPGMDIRDLGRLMTSHPKFAECQTKRAFHMLFLRDPKTSSELNTAASIASKWATEDDYNYRMLVKRWMTSDVYRGMPQDNNPDWVRRVSPERMESLITDLTGFTWTREPDDDQNDADPESDPPRTAPVPLLTSEERGFKVILGGINGTTVSGRSTSLNASVIQVQRKLASLAADHVVTTDLSLPDDQRKLLVGVNGGEDPVVDEAALRGHIVRLMRRLYGRRVTPDSPQVNIWYQLYASLYADETQGGTNSGTVPGNAGERAWRGVVTAMLRSPKIVLY